MASVTVSTEKGILRRPMATTGWWSWFTTVDHKKIGILYGVSSFLFFVLGGLEALLIRSQLAQARQHPAQRGAVQPDLHDARADDDLPVRHADVGRVLQLPDPVDDRCARRRVPEAQRAVVLGLPAGRALPELELVPRRRAGRRLVRLPAQLGDRPRQRHDVLRDRPADHRHRLDHRRDQPGDHDPQHAGARHVDVPHAGVRLDGPHRAVPAGVLAADHHGRAVPAAVRPTMGHGVLRSDPRRRTDPVAAHVLVVRAPGGLHPDLARVRHHQRDPAGVQSQAAVRLSVRRLQRARDRVHRLRRVGAPHVRRRARARRQHGVRDHHGDHRDPHRREDLQLDGHDVRRRPQVRLADAVRGRRRRDVRDRRALRCDARDRALGLPADRHLLHRGALPLRAVRRRCVRAVRRDVLLVAEGIRPHAQRTLGQGPFLGDARSGSISPSARCTSSASAA